MRIKILGLLLIVLPLKVAMAANAALEDLSPLLMMTESLTADFQQIMMNDHGSILQEANGKIWLKKPGLFRWEVQGKDPRLVISNGKKIWDYDKELEQVTVQKFSQYQSQTPVFFLTGELETLEKDFRIQKIQSHPHCLKKSEQCFELQPTEEQSAFQSIKIGFKNKVLHEMEMLDQLGQKTFFILSNTQLNPSLSPDLFKFTPPKGVDVVGD